MTVANQNLFRRTLGWFCASILLIACPSTPRPLVFGRIEKVRNRADVIAAQDQSPSIFAKGEALRAQAERSFQSKDIVGADLYGEHAIAAYSHVVVSSLHAAALAEKSEAEADLKKLESSMESDEQALKEHDRVADRFEHQIVVRREALAPSKSKKVSGSREAARKVVVKANLAVASSLCEAAKLIGIMAKKEVPLLAETMLMLQQTKSLATGNEAPIDDSMRVRAACLHTLTRARELLSPATGQAESIYQMLTSWIQSQDTQQAPWSLRVSRDERGPSLIVTQQQGDFSLFSGKDKLTPFAQTVFDILTKVHKSNASFGLLILVHSAMGDVQLARDQVRAELLKKELQTLGIHAISTQTMGAGTALFDIHDSKKRLANERIEFVFVGTTK